MTIFNGKQSLYSRSVESFQFVKNLLQSKVTQYDPDDDKNGGNEKTMQDL